MANLYINVLYYMHCCWQSQLLLAVPFLRSYWSKGNENWQATSQMLHYKQTARLGIKWAVLIDCFYISET